MGEIATSDRQITIYYSSDSQRAKEAIAYAESEGFSVLTIDILKTPLTGLQILELAGRLGLHVSDLVNQESPAYQTKFAPHDLSDEDWIKMIRKNPEIMKQPIALHGDKTVMVETPTDIIKL